MFLEIPNSVPVKGQFPPFWVFSICINSSAQVYRTPSPFQKKPIATSHISSVIFNLLCPPLIIPALIFTFRVFFLVVILIPYIFIYIAIREWIRTNKNSVVDRVSQKTFLLNFLWTIPAKWKRCQINVEKLHESWKCSGIDMYIKCLRNITAVGQHINQLQK